MTDDDKPDAIALPDLATVYVRHRQGLFTLALSITRCPGRAEDAVHDAFVRLCRDDESRWRDADEPVAYVFSAVRHAAIDLARRATVGGGGASIFENGDACQSTPDALAVGAERADWVARAVEGLPAEQREAVVLRVYAGLSFAQVAAVVGAPLPTVAARYRRALERLRERLRRLV